MFKQEVAKHEAILKRILSISYVIYALTIAYAWYQNVVTNDYRTFGMSIVAMLLPFLIPIIFRLCHLQPIYEINIVAIIFLYFSSLLGSCYGWYSYLFFDKVLHFVSGLMFTLVAIMLFFYIRKSDVIETKEDTRLWIVFINAVNISIALIWEFYEYAILVLFDNDAIHHYTSGVYDSMNDMLCATIAGIGMTWYVVYHFKHDKISFVTNIYKNFYERNIAGK